MVDAVQLLPSSSHLDQTIRRGVWCIVLGLLAFVAIILLRAGPTFTAMAAVALGACCVSFADWRTQRHLWLLGILFLLFLLPTYLAFAYVQLFHLERTGLGTWLDFSLGTMLLGQLCRVLCAASAHNWRHHRSRRRT